jgi:transmembrane sensor
MNNPDPNRPTDRTAERAAADWLARRDRGLTAREQDEYLEWLQADPRRRAMIARHEATLRRMQSLARWQPALSVEANPDLFAPRRPHRKWLAPLLAAAAAVAAAFILTRPDAEGPIVARSVAPGNYLRINERQTLPDGSVVQLREGSQIEVQFNATERRVILSGGEAHFSVQKDSTRPFLVDARGIVVRAIGTSFNVRLDATAVDVLVTEGRVHVEATEPARETPRISAAPVVVAASQRTVMPLAPAPVAPEVVAVTPAQVKEVLAWQAPRLQFFETPLADAVAEFNRHNRHRLVLGDPSLGSIPIGGTFRVDNVEGFVRLLEMTLGVQGEERSSDETVLRRSR